MSTSPYSLDLREKVIRFLEEGKSKKEASMVFKLNQKTVAIWYKRYKEEGHYNPRKRLGTKPTIDSIKFKSYVSKNANETSEEIGKAFGLSAAGARYWLRKLWL